eukprot:s329_g23.t1
MLPVAAAAAALVYKQPAAGPAAAMPAAPGALTRVMGVKAPPGPRPNSEGRQHLQAELRAETFLQLRQFEYEGLADSASNRPKMSQSHAGCCGHCGRVGDPGVWRMKATEAASPELQRWEEELQTAANVMSDDSQAQPELDLAATTEDLQQFDVLCRATAAALHHAQAAPQGEADPLDPWKSLAPVIGGFLWNSVSSPGQWVELLPSIHHFQDLALDMDGEATLAWAPDSFEARVTTAFPEKVLRGNQHLKLHASGSQVTGCWSPSCRIAWKPWSMTALSPTVFLAEFMHSWPPPLLVATLRCINRIAAKDSDKEVKDMAAESLAQANSLVGLRPLLCCSQHQDPKLQRDATVLLKDIWEHSLSGPCWVMKELQHLRVDAYCGDAAEKALSYLRSQSPELVELLHDSDGVGVSASGPSMAAPPGP